MKLTFYYTLPSYWVSYLINGDFSGLEPGEQETIDAFLEKEKIQVIDVRRKENGEIMESYFSHHNDATDLGGDVLEYVTEEI